MGPNRYLIVSDLHFSDVEEHDDGWKAHKRGRHLSDDDLAALLRRFLAKDGGPPHGRTEHDGQSVLVLNGDVFDFDMVSAAPERPPWPVSRSERRRGLDATADKSAFKLRRILADHPTAVQALAAFLAQGHRIVYVLGNHDRELHFPAVQAALLEALHAATSLGTFEDEQLTFEPWFYYVPGEIYVEHGQQYDHFSAFDHLLAPEVPQSTPPRIALPMGNLTNRYLLTVMGFFNPFASDFILGLRGYLDHWLRHYASSARVLLAPWFLGSLVVVAKLLGRRGELRRAPPEGPLLDAVAQRSGIPRATVDALRALQLEPITARFYRVLRELWLDRVLLAVAVAGGALALALTPAPLWIKLVGPPILAPLAFLVYERLAEGETIFTVEERLPGIAQRIATLLDVKLVAMGHTHVPRLIPLGRGATYVDTGTWAPIMDGERADELKAGYRNYLIVSFDEGVAPALEYSSLLAPAEAAPVVAPTPLPVPRAQPASEELVLGSEAA